MGVSSGLCFVGPVAETDAVRKSYPTNSASENCGERQKSISSLFLRLNPASHLRDVRGEFKRNGVYAIPVAMNQIAGLNLQSADFNRVPEIDDMGIGVRHRNAPEKDESSALRPAEIPHGAVGNATHAIQRLRNRRMNFAHQRSEARRAVES